MTTARVEEVVRSRRLPIDVRSLTAFIRRGEPAR